MSFYVVGTAIVVSFHLNRSSHFGDGHFRSDEHFHCFLSNLQTVRQLPQRKKKKKIKVFKHDVTRGTMCNEVLIRNSITVSHTLCFHRVVHWSFIVVNAIRFYGVDLEMLQILANPSREFCFFDYHLLLKKIVWIASFCSFDRFFIDRVIPADISLFPISVRIPLAHDWYT